MAVTTGLVLTGVAATAGVATSIDQKKAGERSEKRQREANRIEKARAEITRGLERKRAAARVRQAQAFNLAGAQVSGISQDSSAVQGAQSSLGASFGASVSGANRSFVSTQSAFDLRQRASFATQNAAANASLVNAGASLLSYGSSIFTPSSAPPDPVRVGEGSAGLGKFRV